MKYRVEIQPAAFQEIEDAYRWIYDNWGADSANRWYYRVRHLRLPKLTDRRFQESIHHPNLWV
jgi:plasmid stabilization system protein ParE